MRKKDKRELSKIIHEMIGADESSAALVADELGKPYSTLMLEINGLYDDETRNKLGALTLIEIMQDRGFAPVLEFLSRLGGYMPPVEMPEGKPGAGDLHRALTRISGLAGKLAERIEAATDEHGPGGGDIVMAELREIDTLARAVIGGVASLKADAQAAVVVSIGEKRRRV